MTELPLKGDIYLHSDNSGSPAKLPFYPQKEK